MSLSARVENKEPRVKGVAFRSIDTCYLELRGQPAHAKARGLMLPELREAYRSGLILSASWYPIAWYRDAFRAFRAASSDGSELARHIGRLTVRHDMQSVYKQLFLKLVSPQLLLSFSGRLFNTYYDTGSMTILESRKGYSLARLTGCVGWDANMWTEMVGAAAACWRSLAPKRFACTRARAVARAMRRWNWKPIGYERA